MGLEGMEVVEMNRFVQLDQGSGESRMESAEAGLPLLLTDPQALASLDIDMDVCAQVVLQAQTLLRKSLVYQKIDAALRKFPRYSTHLYHLPQVDKEDEDIVTIAHRDTAVSNLRLLNIFYGYSHATFALAVNLLDRLLGKVKAHPKYLSCIATCCFYIAVKNGEKDTYIPSAQELVKLSQCGGSGIDLLHMEGLIAEKLQWELEVSLPYTFLQHFYEVFACKFNQLEKSLSLASIASKLEVLMCHYDFTQYRPETSSLALLSWVLQETKMFSEADILGTAVELQYYCQISDFEFLQCRALILEYLNTYRRQTSKVPRLQLVWSVSRRTLTKLKPSTKVLLDLETIMEDEGDEGETESDDAGPFDSENENELERAKFVKAASAGFSAMNSSLSAVAAGEALQEACAAPFIKMMHSKEEDHQM